MHKINSFSLGLYPDITYKARCETCGWSTGVDPHPNRQTVEDLVREHHEDVEKAKARGSNRAPSLSREADKWRSYSEDREIPENERALWKQLADEADRRLGRSGPQWEDVPLPLIDTKK